MDSRANYRSSIQVGPQEYVVGIGIVDKESIGKVFPSGQTSPCVLEPTKVPLLYLGVDLLALDLDSSSKGKLKKDYVSDTKFVVPLDNANVIYCHGISENDRWYCRDGVSEMEETIEKLDLEGFQVDVIASCNPGSHQLKRDDIIYPTNSADSRITVLPNLSMGVFYRSTQTRCHLPLGLVNKMIEKAEEYCSPSVTCYEHAVGALTLARYYIESCDHKESGFDPVNLLREAALVSLSLIHQTQEEFASLPPVERSKRENMWRDHLKESRQVGIDFLDAVEEEVLQILDNPIGATDPLGVSQMTNDLEERKSGLRKAKEIFGLL